MAFAFDDIIESLQNFDPDQLNDLNQVGSWPIAVKVIIWSVVFLAALGAGYFIHITKLEEVLVSAQAKEGELRGDYEDKYFKAIHLDDYRKQKIEMEKSFKEIVRQLPKDTEIPGLIEDITLVGLKNGLTITSIDLQPEVKHEFYIEKPIKIVVNGGYHDLGSFVSDVADLSRIVTLHDFSIGKSKGTGKSGESGGLLTMQILAKTYRNNEDQG